MGRLARVSNLRTGTRVEVETELNLITEGPGEVVSLTQAVRRSGVRLTENIVVAGTAHRLFAAYIFRARS